MNITAQKHLAAMIEGGATLVFTSGSGPEGIIPLGAAELLAGGLAWVEMWPDNEFASHLTPVDRVEVDGIYLSLYAAGNFLGTIAPMEDDEPETFRLAEWRGAKEMHAFCSRMLERLRQL